MMVLFFFLSLRTSLFIVLLPFQRRIAGLHQNTSIGSTDITDVWEPLEEGLLPYETVDSFLLSSSCKCYSLIIYGYIWFSVLLQFGDYSSCFNDYNYFFKEGVGYFIHWVSELGLDSFSILGQICQPLPLPSQIFNF